jgi:hypothetical protein
VTRGAGDGSTVPPSRRAAVAWVAVAVLVVGSLLVRVVHRGTYYPGFDALPAANGLYLVSTRSLGDAIAYVWTQNRQYGMPFPYYSALAALVPGIASALVPWPYWTHVVVFLASCASLWLLARAARLDAHTGWIALLAFGASPTLLTLTLCGFAWATAMLPHALALWLVLDPKFRRRPLMTLGLGLLTLEVAWHCYEIGKTVPAVFAAAAVLLPGASWATRVTWASLAALGVAAGFHYSNAHTYAYVLPETMRPAALLEGIRFVGRQLFVDHYLDQPTLVIAGLLACLVVTRTRLLVASLFALQLGLVVALALSAEGGYQSRPRRFVMVDFYALALVSTLFGEATDVRRLGRTVRAAIVGVLIAGAGWQVTNLVRFVRQPFPRHPGGFAFTMPYSHSQVDYMVTFEDVDFADELRRRAGRGEHLFVIYNLRAYDENVTNPSGILERVYLGIGHDAFVERVFVFGANPCVHQCLPIRPMSELDPFLDRLRMGDPVAATSLTGYVVAPQPMDLPVFVAERARLLTSLEERFVLEYQDPDTVKFRRFSLRPRENPRAP